MKRSTRWMIFTVYYISQLLGLVGFSYNSRSGKLENNRFISFYSSITTILLFFTVPAFFHLQWHPSNLNQHELHVKIKAVMFSVHIGAVLITAALNRIRSQRFMTTITGFISLRENFVKKFNMSAKVERFYESAIRKKFYSGLILNTILFFLSRDLLKATFGISFPPVLAVLAILNIVLSLIMTHYFFALLNIGVLLAVVNEELKRILNSSVVLVKLQSLKKIKAGALVKACCSLADQLDELAIQHYKLQNMGERVSRLYDLHGVCVLLTLFLNNISVIYITYKLFRQKASEIEFFSILTISLLFYIDLSIYVINMLNYGEFARQSASLLNSLQHLMPSLDERFEKSLENFSIQLAAFPFQMKVLGLFQFNRSIVFATFGSTISNAIVLMQYDYKYSKV